MKQTIRRVVPLLAAVAALMSLGAGPAFAAGKPEVGAPSANGYDTITELAMTTSANPNGASTTVQIEYGTTESLGSSTAPLSIGSGTAWVKEINTPLRGLSADTKYYFRTKASNSYGSTTSAIGNKTTFKWQSYKDFFKGWTLKAKFPETYSSSGTFHLGIASLALTIDCVESGNGTIGNTGGVGDKYNMWLSSCVTRQSGVESTQCKPAEPISMKFNQSFVSTEANLLWIDFKESCPLSDMVLAAQEPVKIKTINGGDVNYPMTLTTSTVFGTHVVEISESTTWTLSGASVGAAFGFRI